MIFKNLCVLVLWTKIALALEGLRYAGTQGSIHVRSTGTPGSIPITYTGGKQGSISISQNDF